MGWINQEDTGIINVYTPNIRVPKYIKQIWKALKGEIDTIIIIGGTSILPPPLSAMNRQSKQNRETLELNLALDQMNLTCR